MFHKLRCLSPLHQFRKTKSFRLLVNSPINAPRFFKAGFSFPIALRPVTHASLWLSPKTVEPKLTGLLCQILSKINDSKKKCSLYDVGANVGWHSWNCKSVAPKMPLELFEPDKENVDLLNQTIEHSSLLNTRVHTVALSNRDGTGFFSADPLTSATGTIEPVDTTWSEHYLNHPSPKIRVRCCRLDSFLDELPPPGLIKIDVEGHEHAVLEGCEVTLQRFRPILIVESFPPRRDIIFEFLTDFGYTVADAETLTDIADHTDNLIAIHPDTPFPIPDFIQHLT